MLLLLEEKNVITIHLLLSLKKHNLYLMDFLKNFELLICSLNYFKKNMLLSLAS